MGGSEVVGDVEMVISVVSVGWLVTVCSGAAVPAGSLSAGCSDTVVPVVPLDAASFVGAACSFTGAAGSVPITALFVIISPLPVYLPHTAVNV